MTGPHLFVPTEHPHPMGGAQKEDQMHGALAMAVPHLDILTPLRGLISSRITLAGLTGTNSLIEIPATLTRLLAHMRTGGGGNRLLTDPTMTPAAVALVPMPSMCHSKSMETQATHITHRTGTNATPLRGAMKLRTGTSRETDVS